MDTHGRVAPLRDDEMDADQKALAAEIGGSRGGVGALRTNTVPPFTRGDERLIYDIFSQLSGARSMDDATYARGVVTFDVPATNGERSWRSLDELGLTGA